MKVSTLMRIKVVAFAVVVSALLVGQHVLAIDSNSHDEHAHHHAMLDKRSYVRTSETYSLVDRPLINADGQQTTLVSELDANEPVLLNFIFTTCSTICPVLTATFSKVERTLHGSGERFKILSITIDPEHDTPARLRSYADKFGASSKWQFLTGEREDIVAVQKMFDIYRGNKMSHEPVTLIRHANNSSWVRLNGFARAADIIREFYGFESVSTIDP